MVADRLRDLNMMIPIPRDASLNAIHNAIPVYQNNAFEGSIENLSVGMKRYHTHPQSFPNFKLLLYRMGSTPHLWNESIPNNLAIPYDGFQFCTTQSEFNASIFVPSLINDDMQIPGEQSEKYIN